MQYVRALVVASLTVAAAFGQPAFEVASVKPSPEISQAPIGLFTYPGGRIVATDYSLRFLIHDAYGIEPYRILGGPRWAGEDRFDIEAKPPASSESSHWVPANFKTPPNPEMRQMLQALLAERFQLQVHMETRKTSVFALVAAKGGAKLRPPASTTFPPFVSFLPQGLRGQNATMDQLAERLASLLSRPVLNRTGIQGNFDFTINCPPDDNMLLVGALPDQLGLKLKTQPGSMDVLVIDHAEKPASN
jgi:uncharacterized protein (TIGR03435 family)